MSRHTIDVYAASQCGISIGARHAWLRKKLNEIACEQSPESKSHETIFHIERAIGHIRAAINTLPKEKK